MEQNTGATTAAARSAYETKVGVEAVLRSGGKNPQLKGVVHEVLYRDSITVNPQNVVTGIKGSLTKSATAVRDDVLAMQGGSVVGRAQLKDTVAGINKTVSQAASGKYAGTKLMGTKETVEAYKATAQRFAQNGKTVTQEMTSTGISSVDTTRIAAQTIGGTLNVASVAKTAFTSGGAGAVLSGGIEVVMSGMKLAKGEIEGGEFVKNVAKETIGGGLSAAAGGAAATVVATGAATLLAATAAPLWVPGAIAVGAAVAVGTGIKALWDELWL
ncbi:MAG: hypothetical protein RSB55_08300 [Oscillospiraceae bacterium]